jgi:hypothetical protein
MQARAAALEAGASEERHQPFPVPSIRVKRPARRLPEDEALSDRRIQRGNREIIEDLLGDIHGAGESSVFGAK